MKKQKYKRKNRKFGFTFIEALVVLFIFSLITLTFYQLNVVGLKHIQDSKNRLRAIALASEKMEIIRNLKYEDIGTINGAVSGNLPDDEEEIRSGIYFRVRTTVEYIQDSLDGMYPEDSAWEDYKKVSIEVFWADNQKSVEIVSRFVPSGLETANIGDGILLVNVFSDQPGGSGVANSFVRVVNNEIGLDTTVKTDSTGSVFIMGDKVQSSIQKYQITLTKSGYETVSTMPPYPISSYNPVNVHASVVTGSINVINIVQNQLANLKIFTVNHLNEPLANINFNLKGGKIIGTQAIYPFDSVYNFDENETTNSNGEKDFDLVSPGQYFFTLGSSVENYVLIDTDPISPAFLFSNNNLNLTARLASKTITSLLVRVKANIDNEPPLVGAQVRLTNSLGYDQIQTTSVTGTVFFPVSNDIFESGEYRLEISADDFHEEEKNININANELKIENIKLDAV